MTLLVEDGTGLATAEGYLSVVSWRQRAMKFGLGHLKPDDKAGVWIMESTDSEVEEAIRRATLSLDGIYHDQWLGYRVKIDQALDWPRGSVRGEYAGTPYEALQGIFASGYYPTNASYYTTYYGPYGAIGTFDIGNMLPSDKVPERVLQAVTHLTARELLTPGYLTPDDFPSEQIVSQSVGDISVTYRDSYSSSAPRIELVRNIIGPLLRTGSRSVVALERA